ncbi:MAG: T9SS type A sorting domain-containing protein [Lentimicrobium sp.]
MKKLLLLLVFALSFALNSSIYAQTTFSWRNDQNPTSGQWNVASYWWNGSAAALPGGAEILFLDGNVGTSMTNDLPSNNRFRILFGAGGASRIVSGTTENTFYDYSSNKPKIENSSSSNQTIAFPIKIGNANGMELNSVNGDLTITGAFNRNAFTLWAYSGNAKTLHVKSAFSGGGDIYLLTGTVMNVGTGGSITGGVVYVENGTLTFSGTGNLSSTTDVRINASQVLNLSDVSIIAKSVAERGSGNAGTINLGSGTLTLTGGWEGTLYQNSISGTGSIVKQGSGTLALYGTQSFSGNATVEGGILSSSSNLNAALITVNSTATFSTSENISVNSLTLENESTLNIATGKTLTINGTLTIKGSYTITGGGTLAYGANGVLKYEGSTISATADNVFPSSNGPKDLLIVDVTNSGITLHANRTLAGALTISLGEVFIIPVNRSLTVSGDLTNHAGNTGLVIKSDPTGTGSLKHSTAGVLATVERYLTNYSSPTDHKYHFISSPVAEQAIREEFVTNTPSSDVDFYSFDEETNTWINTKLEGGGWNSGFESNFLIGKGYLVAYPSNLTKNFTGELNTYPSSLVLTCTNTSGQGGGWNLLGNPFPSAIDWDYVTTNGLGDGIDDALYYYDNIRENYCYYIKLPGDTVTLTGQRYIPAMQGFMVHAKTTGTKTVSIDNGARTHSGQDVFYKTTNTLPGSLSLKATGNGHEDEAFIHFNLDATTAFDGSLDAYKLRSYSELVPMIYTTGSDGSQLAINGLPDFELTTIIPVYFEAGVDGDYNIEANLTSFTEADVYLEDKLLNQVQNLTANPLYSFSSQTGDEADRFNLYFSPVGIDNPAAENSLVVFTSDKNIVISNAPARSEISILNLTGQVVLRGSVNGSGLTTIHAGWLPEGIYIVSVVTGNQSVSKKVSIR